MSVGKIHSCKTRRISVSLKTKSLHLLDHHDALEIFVAVYAVSCGRTARGADEASPFVESYSLYARTRTLCQFADSHKQIRKNGSNVEPSSGSTRQRREDIRTNQMVPLILHRRVWRSRQ